mmetsp:Transcript_20029/g.57512  ORF Transcript_20029/g.57512 Transcript_20029/m.57512 type:complete len:535 (-) Transcript_20029:32-1636(-)
MHPTCGSSRWHYWLLFLALGVANSGDATEIGCMNYILSHPLFIEEILLQPGAANEGAGGTAEGDYSGRGAAIASSIFAGMLIGGIVTGAYGDRIGRRPTLLAGLFLNAISGVCSSLSPTAGVMCLFRFLAGLGIGAVLSSLITLATELSPPAHRGWYITLVGGFWTLGAIFVAVLAYALFELNDYSWRIFALIAAAPTFVGGVLVWLVVPESPRFLALHGQYERAARICNEVADAMGYRGAPLTVKEVRDAFEPIVRSKAHSPPLSGREALRKIGDLYRRDLAWKVTVPLQVVWFSMSFGSGLCTWITKIFSLVGLENVYLQSLYFALANLPGNIAAAYAVDKFGRKTLLFASMAFAALSLALAAEGARDTENVRQLQVVLAACSFHAFLVSGWCALSVMTSELFPTAIRGTGMGVCSGVGRAAGILVQFVNGALIHQPLVLLLAAAGCMMCGAFAPIVLKTPDLANCHLSDFSGPALGVVEGDGQAIMKIVHDDVVAESQRKAWKNDGAGDNDVEIDPDGTGLAERRKRREMV